MQIPNQRHLSTPIFTDITQLTKELQIFFAIRSLDNLDRLGRCIYISLHNYKQPIVAKCAKPWEIIIFDEYKTCINIYTYIMYILYILPSLNIVTHLDNFY